MAEPHRPRDSFPRDPDVEPTPGFDPVHPANDPAVERDPAMRGGRRDTVVNATSNRSSLIFAGVIAALLVIALLFFVNWTPTDPQTTAPGGPAVTEEPATAPTGTAPAGDATAPAPAGETTAPAPAGEAAEPAAPAAPAQ